MNLIKYHKFFLGFSTVLILTGIGFLILWGLNPGIDFSGGSLFEIEYEQRRPPIEEIEQSLEGFGFEEKHVRPIGDKGITLRVREENISHQRQEEVVNKLTETEEIDREQVGFSAISPVIGGELRTRTMIVIALSLIIIVLYIAFAFRKVSRPIASWQYGIASLLALGHDLLIPLGVFAFLGRFYGVQITIPVITAFLVILGYSINDTVVVFDRIRENLLKLGGEDYEKVVDSSIKETLARSISTSVTTLLVLFSIFFFGGETLKYFSLALIMGIVAGTYSSLLIAPPLLASWVKKNVSSNLTT